MMKSNVKSAMVGFAVGLAAAAGGARAAVQTTQHEHQTPSTQTPAADANGKSGMKGMDGMKDMDAMMADPAMRQKMMANIAQCQDMMAMMMEHMKHGAETAKQPPHGHQH